jgi:hypothetical protein
MYNVLRRGEPLTAVAATYGRPVDLPDDEILRLLVALNAERAEEESRGVVRWLRPDFQIPPRLRESAGR